MKICLSVLVGAVLPSVVASPLRMPPNPNPYQAKNSDGTTTPLIRIIGEGETLGEIYEETVKGFTVNKINGTYKYLELDNKTGYLIDSGLQVGKHDPIKAAGKSGKKLKKGAKGKTWSGNAKLIVEDQRELGIPEEHRHSSRRLQSWVGSRKNLVVPFKFSDHTSRTAHSTTNLQTLMNNQGPNPLCPTGSVRDVFLQSSYGQLDLNSTIAPWVTLPNSEAYYAAGNSGGRAQEMIRDALNQLDASGFDFRPFDEDGDGYADAIAFLHSGYGAEWGGTDAYGTYYTDRMWSHKWTLWQLPGGKWASNDGVSVYNYHVSPSVWGISGSAIGRIGVIAHETGHFLGLPDLYDGLGGNGIGSYCLMANSWGFDGSQYYPPHFSAWAKFQLGWITPTRISSPGTYSVRQACDFPDVYLIDQNYPAGEYLLIENRQKCDFDAKIAGEGGLAIFHIDDSASFTEEGFPGQSGWPSNGLHYRVALLQADGEYNMEKGVDRGNAYNLFNENGVSGIGPAGTSSGAGYPNTNAYKGGSVVDTGVLVSNISVSGRTMTFTVGGPQFLTTPPTKSPTLSPTASPTLHPTTSWSIITYDNFENGWGNFTSGGVDASRYIGRYAHQGTAALLIQDNSGSASSVYHKSSEDATRYNQLRVHFWFYPFSMDNKNEDFFLEYSSNGGTSWKNVKRWVFSVDFVNDRFYEAMVYLNRTDVAFTNRARLRFHCDASDDGDKIFIDEVEFSGK